MKKSQTTQTTQIDVGVSRGVESSYLSYTQGCKGKYALLNENIRNITRK